MVARMKQAITTATRAALEAIARSDHDCPGIHEASVEIAAAADTPYAMSQQCTWHGDPRSAGTRRAVLPRGGFATEPACPHCGSPLIEVFSAQVWWNSVRYNRAQLPDYEAMMLWSEGKCFPDFEHLRNAYRQAMEGEA